MYRPHSSIIRRRPSQRGSALIMVIWLISMLGMIVYAMLNIVKHDADLAIAQKQAFRARQVAEMGINWAMNPAVKKYDRDILDQTLEDGSTFSAKIKGEGGRLNINFLLQGNGVHKEFLKNLFELWGLKTNDRAVPDMLFDRMADWIDADSNTTGVHGWEKEEYVAVHGVNTPYPFNRPFYTLDEMLLVPGWDLVVANLPDWRDYFTIYSVGVAVDVNEAEAKVLAAVAQAAMNRTSQDDHAKRVEEAQEFVVLRWGPDQTEDTEDDVKMDAPEALNALDVQSDPQAAIDPASYFGSNDQTTHIECVATVGDYRKRVVLIVRGRTGTPQILSREEVPLFQ